MGGCEPGSQGSASRLAVILLPHFYNQTAMVASLFGFFGLTGAVIKERGMYACVHKREGEKRSQIFLSHIPPTDGSFMVSLRKFH